MKKNRKSKATQAVDLPPFYRHGDVIISRIDKIPNAGELEKLDRCVCALGEVTGHSHRVDQGAGQVTAYATPDRVKESKTRGEQELAQWMSVDAEDGVEIVLSMM